jgi:hypothetical protein
VPVRVVVEDAEDAPQAEAAVDAAVAVLCERVHRRQRRHKVVLVHVLWRRRAFADGRGLAGNRGRD